MLTLLTHIMSDIGSPRLAQSTAISIPWSASTNHNVTEATGVKAEEIKSGGGPQKYLNVAEMETQRQKKLRKIENVLELLLL